MHNKVAKLENPNRISELAPVQTLKQINLKPGDIFCDIGAGTGIFTIPAAQITGAVVYALEISDQMIDLIRKRASEQSLNNIVPVKVSGDRLDLADNSCDVAMMCTVYHELDNKEAMLKEIHRILKPGGKLEMIEFYDKDTPMGPPATHRVSYEDILETAGKTGFNPSKTIDMGENCYLLELLTQE